MAKLRIIGGGLAGCEAAWQAASQGVSVTLYEMRPVVSTGAHQTGRLAELVCSNSLRAIALENAVGLLKEEMSRLGSLIVAAARASAVPAGGALAVDRERFSFFVEERIAAHPLIELRREEVRSLDESVATIVACGPLGSEALAAELSRLCGKPHLHYYDAASPIVAADSIDRTFVFEASRYGKGGADYLNIPLDKAQYLQLVEDLVSSPKAQPHGFESDLAAGAVPYFESCLPVEEMARRGPNTLRFGPLKPVGLESAPAQCRLEPECSSGPLGPLDPECSSGQTVEPVEPVEQARPLQGPLRQHGTRRRPYAVVQLRRENAAATAYNMVGFQTRLTWPAQKATFGKLPGLANAEWLRLGVMHRNTFVDAPRVLSGDLSLRNAPMIFVAGQVSGCEGYVEAAATGILAAHNACRRVQGISQPFIPPATTAIGSLLAYLRDDTSHDFQPQNVTFAYMTPLEQQVRDKRERRRLLAQRALSEIDRLAAQLQAQGAAHEMIHA